MLFGLACAKGQGAIVVSLSLALTLALVSHFKALRQRFLCDGQGTSRQAILFADRSRVSCFRWYYVKFQNYDTVQTFLFRIP